jgi:molecular chaperone DnaK
MDPVIGIDLGTTNSEVAFVMDGKVTILKENDNGIIPSCVGLNQANEVIVGVEARNQAVLYPENTVLSVKRRMGTDEPIVLNNNSYTPREISAFILKELKERAERITGQAISRAVITTPAYFTDIQRQATREAGEIAGLNVIRILNEPTAAALSYESSDADSRTIMVYDLGGGTFDVSIVKIEDKVVEVLASTGDNHLGGDDFDHEIEKILINHIKDKFDVDVSDQRSVVARLKLAAENAKIVLSQTPFVKIEEDHLIHTHAGDVHLSFELSRLEFETAIDHHLQKTMDSVNKAFKDAGILPSDLDKIILVGGSTRIPRLSSMLEEKFGRLPHQEIDPDLCVAMGAAIQAGREMGIESSSVLIDITPYTFGTSALGEIDGIFTPHRFAPIIQRNSKLPAVKSEAFGTVVDNQEEVEILVYQGENPSALENVEIGKYFFKLSPQPVNSVIIIKFELDLNGILKIKGIEKNTGREITGIIENAFSKLPREEVSLSQDKIQKMWAQNHSDDPSWVTSEEPSEKDLESSTKIPKDIERIISQAKEVLEDVSEEDQEDIINLIEDIHDALLQDKEDAAREMVLALEDLLFYIE